MVDWKRLGLAVLSVALVGGLIAILLFAPKVYVILGEVAVVCIIVGIIIAIYRKVLNEDGYLKNKILSYGRN